MVLAVVVCKQNRRGWVENDRAKQALQFLRTIVGEPAGAFWLSGHGGHKHFSSPRLSRGSLPLEERPLVFSEGKAKSAVGPSLPSIRQKSAYDRDPLWSVD